MGLTGIISDTHGMLDAAVYEAFANVDVIVHAGDIGSHSLLWELETIAPVVAVRGNNDWEEYGSAVGDCATPEIGGVNLFVSHFPAGPRRRRAPARTGWSSTATRMSRARSSSAPRGCSTPGRPPDRAAAATPPSCSCASKTASWGRCASSACSARRPRRLRLPSPSHALRRVSSDAGIIRRQEQAA